MALTKTYTPGPPNDQVDREDIKLSGSVPFDDSDDSPYEGLDPRNLKRGQYIEITVRGYIAAIGEVAKTDGKREITVQEYSFKTSQIRDLEIIAEPAPRPSRNGQLPGQTTMAVLDPKAIEKSLRADGIDATVETINADSGVYPRASLRIGSDGATGELIVLNGDTDDIITLNEAPLPAGPWTLPSGFSGTVIGLIDPDTAAVASGGIVLAVPTDHFIDGTIKPGITGDAEKTPPVPDVIEDPPPSAAELLADDGAEDPAARGPLAPGEDPAMRI